MYVTVWSDHDGLFSGVGCNRLDDQVKEFARNVDRDGHAITSVGTGPWNHHVIGVGVGHDDAEFAERGRSMAAYYENERPEGPWWDNLDGLFGLRGYYDPSPATV